MRNLAQYPITHEEIIEKLMTQYEAEALGLACGDMGPSLLRSAIVIIRREQEITAKVSALIEAARTSSESMPERFIQQLEAAVPRLDNFGQPL